MRYYASLLRLRCFTQADVAVLTGSKAAAEALLTEYRRRGYVDRVRRNLWVALSLEDNQPVASRYRIASAINETATVSHHSAFEYYGYANQIHYETYVTAKARFVRSDYDGVSYRHIAPRISAGVEIRPDGVRVTDLERTTLDSINDFEKIAGREELLACLELVPYLDPDKLLTYLALYDKRMLYQKSGYLLSLFNEALRLPEYFFAECTAHVGKSVRYLDQDLPASERHFDPLWQLVVPTNPIGLLNQGAS